MRTVRFGDIVGHLVRCKDELNNEKIDSEFWKMLKTKYGIDSSPNPCNIVDEGKYVFSLLKYGEK